jgi:polysaccharide pyruvyl transferase WcaK-like protein
VKKFLLIGYLGANNLGDECMLRQFLSLFDEYPHVGFIIDSHGIDYTTDRISTHFIPPAGSGRRHKYDTVLKDVDGVVWVGGNCFTDYDGEGAARLLLLAKRMGKRFYYVGVGTDRLTRVNRMLRTFIALHLADGVIFRDAFSLNHAKKWLVNSNKLTIGPDLGEIYIRRTASNYFVEEGAIVISWRELKKNISNQEEVLQNLATVLINLSLQHDKQLMIFNTDEYSDKEVHDALINLLTKRGFLNFVYLEDTTLEQKLTIISKASCVITARLHTAMAADIFGKPTFLYDYSQKIVEFARGKENVTVVSGSLAGLLFDKDLLKSRPICVPVETSDTVYRDFVLQRLMV